MVSFLVYFVYDRYGILQDETLMQVSKPDQLPKFWVSLHMSSYICCGPETAYFSAGHHYTCLREIDTSLMRLWTFLYMGLQQIYQPCALKSTFFFSFHFYCTFGILQKQKTLAFSRALLELPNHYYPPKNDFDDIWNGISSSGNYVNWRCILELARHHR